MYKFLTYLLCFLLLIIVLEWRYYNGLNQLKPSSSPQATVQPTASLFKILYQAPGDKEGRTVVFETDKDQFLQLEMIREEEFTYPKRKIYAVGGFGRWESTDGGNDKFLILNEPLTDKFMIKTRVDLDADFGVEDIKTRQLSQPMKKLSDFNQKEIASLIKQGDVVSVYFSNIGNKVKLDDQGNPVVIRLILRRKVSL